MQMIGRTDNLFPKIPKIYWMNRRGDFPFSENLIEQDRIDK